MMDPGRALSIADYAERSGTERTTAVSVGSLNVATVSVGGHCCRMNGTVDSKNIRDIAGVSKARF